MQINNFVWEVGGRDGFQEGVEQSQEGDLFLYLDIDDRRSYRFRQFVVLLVDRGLFVVFEKDIFIYNYIFIFFNRFRLFSERDRRRRG